MAEAARERLRTDVYRLTLEHNLAQEIVQETLVEMLKILGNLREPDKFWPWLYKIALNKLRLHHRTRRRHNTVPLSSLPDANLPSGGQEAMAGAISHELKQIVLSAMRQLKPRHRAVLTMRCYREMEYSLIANAMGCSEFAAKMLFYRAKLALKKQLARNGLHKGSLLMALVLFGKLTAPSEAAAAQISVTAATVNVGVAATLTGIATSKPAVVSVAAAGMLAVSSVMVTEPQPDLIRDAARMGMVETKQISAAQTIKETEEYWHYYPPRGNGAVMMRLMKGRASARSLACQFLQDEQANYHFDGHANAIYLINARAWHSDLSVWQLPTDNRRLREFIWKVEGKRQELEYTPRARDGLLVVTRESQDGANMWTTRHLNVLDEEYFKYNWSAGAQLVDVRDAMHRRGWTYFEITGQIDGQQVTGTGTLPFVFAASLSRPAWIKLQAGELRLEDSGREARVYDAKGRLSTTYEGGSFFQGLSRPWAGLHSVDTVRRDAAAKQVWFETKHLPESKRAEVVLTKGQTKLAYTIDLASDLVEKIEFSGSSEGWIQFHYLQNIAGKAGKFVEPKLRVYGRPEQRSPGILWLVNLVEGGLARN